MKNMEAKALSLAFMVESVYANLVEENSSSWYPRFFTALLTMPPKDKQNGLTSSKEPLWQQIWIWFVVEIMKHATIHSPLKKTGQ